MQGRAAQLARVRRRYTHFGNVAAGEVYLHRFDTPGTYRYLCTHHADLVAVSRRSAPAMGLLFLPPCPSFSLS